MCLVVGADRLGAVERLLPPEYSREEYIHWDGRSRRPSMSRVTKVVVLTGFINHNAVNYVKKEAKKRGISMIFLRRGISDLSA
ncbi:DUF2325 domain-containing protein [Heliorestis convoluta]|uniref:DUF2325 domain-containing protein n=1 Tax=Heliorestis convoluta TaxID=356322 RepID=A0A5Q2MY37_9FIRM|nr:DUF2325 domain-containing protein [Heliorestis convoluta]QGG46293.1 hypothetical protein FTV88_0114 [Heliorestis convoluta]